MDFRRFRGRDLLSIADLTPEELRFVINLSLDFKRRFYSGERVIPLLQGKVLGLVFQKHSTRTRVSLETAMAQLGGRSLYLSWNELQLGRGEPIKDTARVLERYIDGVAARVYRHKDLVEFAEYARIPIINALSDLEHPLQAIADMMTILEKKGRIEGLKIAFLGDGSDNVLHSLLLASSMLGARIYIATAPGYDPNSEILKRAEEEASRSGAEIKIVRDPIEAVEDADVVYTDVWVSMGQEAEREKRLRDLSKYQVNAGLVKHAKKDYIFMHCLPAHRGEEVTEDVIESPNSVVWDEAENRLHSAKAVLSLLLG
ncbi:MAG: ornithine carbamoyltransferase [Thermoprotei archaeon]|nr:MAG: ornithine carbamoyltransferase [Thermoprotei archaeon]